MKICCPRCGQEYEVEETILGQNVECPICQKKFIAASSAHKNTSIKKETPSPKLACPWCRESISIAAKKCRYCGEYIDESYKPIDRGLYIIIAMFFGLLGLHNFYAGENNAGFLHIGIIVLSIVFILFFFFFAIGSLYFLLLIDAILVFIEAATINRRLEKRIIATMKKN